MAGISFDDYIVKELSYKKNDKFEGSGSVELNTQIECVINMTSETNAEVILSTLIGSSVNRTSPFEIKADILGEFTFNIDDSDGKSFESFLTQNAIAILFPYLRNIVSNVSSVSNEFPTLILPVVNIVNMLEQKNGIKINRIYSE